SALNLNKDLIEKEKEKIYEIYNCDKIPCVISKSEGVKIWDINNKEYYDFLSINSSVNQGHNHPKLIEFINKQISYNNNNNNNILNKYYEFMCDKFNYENCLLLNSSLKAFELSINMALNWGYQNKNIIPNEAIILCTENNFWCNFINSINSINSI